MARKTTGEWLSLIDEFTQSGLTQTAFCAQHQLNPNYFSLKRTKLTGQNKTNAFARLSKAPVSTTHPERIVINCGAISIELSGASPLPMIIDLVKALA